MTSSRTRQPDRQRYVAAALVGVVMLATYLVTGAQLATGAPSGRISVSRVAVASSAPCLEPAFAGYATVDIESTTYTVTVYAHAPICPQVTAVVYSMPQNFFWPWPQHKVESTTFTIGAGVTTIVFARDCTPQQFDVVTGDAPESIQPVTGPLTGPMLYNIPWTGVQDWNGPCTGASTTSTAPQISSTTTIEPESTTTATTATTSSTVPESVLPLVELQSTATTPEATSTTTSINPVTSIPIDDGVLHASSIEPGVLDATESRAVAPAATTGSNLAFTGASSGPVSIAGAAMLTLGAALVVRVRRRRA